MSICSSCKKTMSRFFWAQGKLICHNCIPYTNQLYLDKVEITEAGPKLVQPISDLCESSQRSAFINFAYTLFNCDLNKSAYPLMKVYRKKGYSWLGMLRAMEWFYVIKKNPISKAKNNIGIIPFIYNEAQEYYANANKYYLQKAQEWWKTKDIEIKEITIEKKENKKTNQIDIKSLF